MEYGKRGCGERVGKRGCVGIEVCRRKYVWTVDSTCEVDVEMYYTSPFLPLTQ